MLKKETGRTALCLDRAVQSLSGRPCNGLRTTQLGQLQMTITLSSQLEFRQSKIQIKDYDT